MTTSTRLGPLLALLLVAPTLAACGSSSDGSPDVMPDAATTDAATADVVNADVANADSEADSAATDSAATDGPTLDGDWNTTSACENAGGTCIPVVPGAACPAGSAVSAMSCGGAGASCCLPTTEQDAGDACAAAGGTCVANPGQCGEEVGHLGTSVENAACGSGGNGVAPVCCIEPATSCGGPESFSCYRGKSCFRPQCKDGQLVCPPGQTQGPAQCGAAMPSDAGTD